MTNQQDAYALAAQAAADRARAEALQRGAAPAGPGLQSPTRRLSKNPAVRWVLSGVLLAAGTALAVDYLNTPLRSWLQYYAPVPGAGGKSVARIAAEASAKPQAEIDAATMLEKKEITGPVEARTDIISAEYQSQARELTIQIFNRAERAMEASAGKMSKLNISPIALYEINPNSFTGQDLRDGLSTPIAQHWSKKIGTDPPSYLALQDYGDLKMAILNRPISVPTDSNITPILYKNGHGFAWSEDNRANTIIPVLVKEPNDKIRVGFVTAQDFLKVGFTLPNLSFYTDPEDKEIPQ